MPEPNEAPHETALREFQEETGSSALTKLSPIATLTGSTGKKTLEIYLHEWTSSPDDIVFDVDQVVKIDTGYMAGRPEIIAIQWITLEQAMNGKDGAKIYNSQESILSQAYKVIMQQQQQEWRRIEWEWESVYREEGLHHSILARACPSQSNVSCIARRTYFLTR